MVVVWAGASNTGAAASADTGSRDSSILPVSRMLTMRLAFIGVRSFRVVFIRGSRYYKYTINWAKTKEILREWGLKLREWLKKEGKLKHCCPGTFSFDTKREPEKCALCGVTFCLPSACRDAPLGQRQGGVFRLPPPYLWTPPTPQRAKGCSPLTILKKKSKHKKASAAPVGAIALTLFSLLHL